MVQIEMNDGGIIRVELDYEAAPISAANFEKLVRAGFYDGSEFHRVISGFMIQGGAGVGGKHADTIKGEFASNGVKNPILHKRGVISMARTMVKDSATSQFFIMHADAPHLDGEYAAFGRVVDGMDVVDRIAETETDWSDRPLVPQVMKKVTWID